MASALDEVGLDEAGLDRVFAELRTRGWRLVPQQLAQAQAMLAEMRGAGAAQADIPLVLAPILAKSPEQQAEARRRLAAVIGTAPLLPPVGAETAAVRGSANPPTDVGGHAWPVVVAAGLLLLAVFLGFYFFPAPPPAPVATPTPTATAGPPVTRTETETVVDPAYAAAAAVLGLTPVALLAGWWLVQRRRSREGLGRERGEASFDRLDLGARPVGAALFQAPELAPVARQWRRFQRVPTTELDPERTVMATIAAGGLFTPIHATRPTGSHYLLLIEEAGRHDHLARLADNLADRLADEGVAIQRFYHADGLGLLRAPDRDGGAAARLAELPASPRGAVVLIGSGGALFDRLTATPDPLAFGELARWSRRALLSTRPIAEWGDREDALVRAGYALATATDSGVAALGRHIARGFPQHLGLLEGLRETEDEPPAEPSVALPLAALVAELRVQVAEAEALASGERAGLLASIRALLDRGDVAVALDRLGAEPRQLIDAPRLLATIRAHLRAGAPAIEPPSDLSAGGATSAASLADLEAALAGLPPRREAPMVIDRTVLRAFVQAQMDGAGGVRILFVEGPARSGRSYTAALARQLAGDRLPVVVANFEVIQEPDALTFAMQIDSDLGGTNEIFEGLKSRGSLDDPLALARIVINRANLLQKRPLVVASFCDRHRADQDFWRFVEALAGEASPFSLILVNSSGSDRFPSSSVEQLQRFTVQDVADALAREIGTHVSPNEMNALAKRSIANAGGETASNADIAAEAARMVAHERNPVTESPFY